MDHRSQRRRRLSAGVALAIVLAVSACGGGGGDGDATATASGAGADPSEVSPGGTADSGSEEAGPGVDLALPRTMTYGALTVDVTGAETSSTHPFEEPAAAAEGEEPESTFLGLDITITNPLSEETFSGPAGILQLEYDGGTRSQAFLEDGAGLSIAPRNDMSETFWFEIDADDDASDPILVIEQGEDVPGRLPLTGDEPAPEQVDLAITPASDGGEAAHETTLDITTGDSAWLTLNATVDEDEGAFVGDIRSCGGLAVSSLGRVEDDRALLYLPATVVGSPTDIPGVSLAFNVSSYSVNADATVDGIDTAVCAAFGDLDTEREGHFVFEVPAGSTELTLEIGCPCGGLLTGTEIERALFTTTIDVSDVDRLLDDA